jgi:sporulation protein YlmC with PRC-barrel domain
MAGANTRILSSASGMQLVRVQTTDGRELGRVSDLRIQWDPDGGGPVVTEVIFGKRGFLERLGLRQTQARTVRWAKVKAVHPDLLVVEHS